MTKYIIQRKVMIDTVPMNVYVKLYLPVSANKAKVEYTTDKDDAFLFSKEELEVLPTTLKDDDIIEVHI